MNEITEEILKKKIAKIHEISDGILKKSYPFCRNTDVDILTSGQAINRDAYLIKVLTEQISGLLK